MRLELLRNVLVDGVEESAELDAAVSPMMLRNDLAALDIKGREERGGPVTDVVVGPALDLPRPQRQNRLRAIQSLDLRLLIDAEHHGPIGRIQVQAHDVAHLFDEQWVCRELEAFATVGPQPKCAPDPRDAAPAQASPLGQRTSTPVRGVLGLALQSQRHHTLNGRIGDLARRTRPRLVQKSVYAALDETPAPTPDGLTKNAQPLRNLSVVRPFSTREDDPCPQRQCLRRIPPSRESLQLLSLLGAQHQPRLGPPSSHRRS